MLFKCLYALVNEVIFHVSYLGELLELMLECYSDTMLMAVLSENKYISRYHTSS